VVILQRQNQCSILEERIRQRCWNKNKRMPRRIQPILQWSQEFGK
jgi:hypothetical protein